MLISKRFTKHASKPSLKRLLLPNSKPKATRMKPAPARLVIIGAGAWGTAVAIHAAAGSAQITLLCRSEAAALALRSNGENTPYLPAQRLPSALHISSDPALLHGADIAFIATPVAGLAAALQLAQAQGARAAVWLCKGLDAGTGLLPHELADSLALTIPVGVLSGPSFAKEVAQGLPCALTVASSSDALCASVQAALHHGAMRVYTSTDVMGVEIGGAVKNVIALACGICDGLALGLNARAALITRGLAETSRFALALGSKPETLMGLTGAGDLVLTCTGSLSRNRSYGLLLAQGHAPASIEAQLGHVAEGARCVAAVAQRATALGVEMPITQAVARIVDGTLAPQAALQAMLMRDARAE
jgi:glycerol-3-phosphate dehydrogenase (NAD(P)+)